MAVVFGAGIWDMTHKGHIDLLEMMRKEAGKDGLVIAIAHSDLSCYRIKGKFPIQSFEHRQRNLLLTDIPDSVICEDLDDPAHTFQGIVEGTDDSCVYMRGDDLTEDFPGKWMLDKLEVPIKFKKYTKDVSSSKIRDSL